MRRVRSTSHLGRGSQHMDLEDRQIDHYVFQQLFTLFENQADYRVFGGILLEEACLFKELSLAKSSSKQLCELI